jgi:hypothetical protein
MDPHIILGVSIDASEIEIRSAYKALSRLLHPDKAGESSTAAFQRLNVAYSKLIDDKVRQPTVEDAPDDVEVCEVEIWNFEATSWRDLQKETNANRPKTRQRKASLDGADEPVEALDWDAAGNRPSPTKIHKSSSGWIKSESTRRESNGQEASGSRGEDHDKLQSEQKAILTDVSCDKEATGALRLSYVDPNSATCSCGCGGSSSLSRYHKSREVTIVEQQPKQTMMTKRDILKAKMQNQRYREHFRNEHKAEKSLKHYESVLQTELNIASKKPKALRNDLLPSLLRGKKVPREETFNQLMNARTQASQERRNAKLLQGGVFRTPRLLENGPSGNAL